MARQFVSSAQTFRNIATALAEAGSSLDEVVRVTYVLPDGSLFEEAWPAMREAFAHSKPAAMMIEAGLSSPAMKIEIQVTALKGSAA
jgi:enamine deaminase RidA (YjgF/YER057c/UK114 family)